VLRLDDADYALAVTRAESNLVEARHALNLEMGYQQVAKKEWELLNGQGTAQDSSQELALRKSHLAKAEAMVAAAQAELERARLDLQRTRLNAPFNAMVTERHIDEGSHVAPQESLATLVGTDTYWVQVSLPVDRLVWLRVPRNGEGEAPRAEIRHVQGGSYQGRAIRLLGDISQEGRMARVLVEVPDPLGLKSQGQAPTPLLLGEYVRVTLFGPELADVYAIPRDALRDNQFIWLAREDDSLEIRTVTPLWRDTERVYLREGLSPGERLIVSDLAGPVAEMPLQIEGGEG
jgi:RND family efflux transporter MFP subunit